MGGVTPVEILMLDYVGRGIRQDMEFPGYWKYQYNGNPQELIVNLLNKGLVQLGDVDISLQYADVKMLKGILTRAGLKVSGKKADLIERVLLNVNKQELLKLKLPTYIILSEMGKELLKDNNQPEMKEQYEAEMVYGDKESILPVIKMIADNKFKEAETSIVNLQEYDEKAFLGFMNFHVKALDKYAPYEKEIKACILYGYMAGKISIANYLISDVYAIKMSHMEFERVKKYLSAMKDFLGIKEITEKLPSGYNFGYYVKSLNDERCCEFCRQMENHFFNGKEAVLGVTYPPFDDCTCDYCRCYASASMKQTP